MNTSTVPSALPQTASPSKSLHAEMAYTAESPINVVRAPAADDDIVWREHARGLIGDLFGRSPAIYWADFLLSVGTAWALTFLYFTADPWSALQAVSFVLAGVLFFRAGTFIHEIVHMPSRQMLWFKRAWNLLLGIPLLMPWVMYRNHIDHHNHRNFGTPTDGEYLPLASSPVRETVKYLAQAPLLPLFMLLRFGVLGPASWFVPGLREWVLTRTTAAVSNPHYRKRFAKREEAHLKIVEASCFSVILLLAGATWRGDVRPVQLLMGYLLLSFTLGLNWIRNLSAHGYGNDGRTLTLADQVADSVNLTGQTWLTLVLFPVGLRYHALHHLFPALPYHNMGEAHRRLMDKLPADAPYRAFNRASYFGTVQELWQSARKVSPAQSAMRSWISQTGRS